jgi:hypothetical protein
MNIFSISLFLFNFFFIPSFFRRWLLSYHPSEEAGEPALQAHSHGWGESRSDGQLQRQKQLCN